MKQNKGKLDLGKVKDALYDWVKSQTEGCIDQNSILFRDQSQPLPPRPCVTLKITSGPQRTGYQDNLGIDEVTGKTSVGGQRVLVVSIQLYGSKKTQKRVALDQLANDLNASLSLPSVLYQLRGAGIAVFNQGEVTNITDLEETEYEERAEFSVMLGVAENILDDPGYFTRVGSISGTIND